MAEIFPCTPVSGSSVDPCENGAGLLEISAATAHTTAERPTVPYSIGDYLDGFGWYEFGIAHIVVRSTYLPGTVRCTSDNSFQVPSHIPAGGLTDYLYIFCYADVRVNDYIVGTGPSVLTVIADYDIHGRNGGSSYEPEGVETLRGNWERALAEGGEQGLHELAVTGPPAGITGREAVLFLGPSSDASIEAWQVHETWDVQRLPGENPVAIHPDLFWYGLFERDDAEFERLRPKLGMELPAFEQAATAAHQARVAANGGRVRPDPAYPMLVSDATQLSSYFREVGAYSDPASPPAQPSPVLTCANGTAVTDPNTN